MPIVHNIAELERGLSDVARRQIPFAVSVGLNRTLGDIKKNEDKRLAKVLDKPTPFTLRAFKVTRSTKRRLSGSIEAREIQGAYLKYAEDGGERHPKGRAIVVPVRQRRNKYGNMPKGAVPKMLARPDTFSGAPTGRPGAGGIYQRTKSGLRLMVSYASSAGYEARLRFLETAKKTAAARLAVNVERAMREAIRTAR